MRIIKVNAIDSTNSFVRKFYEGDLNFEPVCVHAFHQTKGKGQRGAHWVSKPGENLTFSILYPQKRLSISKHFILSASVSLAVIDTLEKYEIPELKVKWPNDILSAKKKLGGILIENVLKNDGIVASVIGIGLNVNQDDFGNLVHAGSLKSITLQSFDLHEILKSVLDNIEKRLASLGSVKKEDILDLYINNMFRKDKVSVFERPLGEKFNGIIRGVSEEGLLIVEVEEEKTEYFGLKEVKLLY